MTGRKDKDPWEEAVAGVKPLKQGGRRNDRRQTEKPSMKEPLAKKPLTKKPLSRIDARDRAQEHTTAPPPKRQSPFDPKLYREISSGKARIDERIDLHGFTEERAFDRLIHAIEGAWARDHRRLLVVTGKGRGGTGVIRSSLPKWLSSPRLTPYVSSFDYSGPRHGGDGAFYVVLRKQR